jgi:tRNA-Thr(GGU) m(6)t(6)A37 methyltransferase TsaA
MTFSFTPIGVVRNGVHERPEKWSDIYSEIHIKKELQDGLDGLSEFSHVVVIFYFHLSETALLKVHPRGNQDLPLVGVFSTRAPVRPNSIGVTIVELVKVEENVITVKGLDAFDGTPVLDLKPHLSCVEPTRVPEWVKENKG